MSKLLHKENMAQHIGTCHLHIDALRVQLDAILRDLATRGVPIDLTGISQAVAGPQRNDPAWRRVYELHTPGVTGEVFDGLVTIALRDMKHAATELASILTTLKHEHGSVIELEKICGVFSPTDEPEFVQYAETVPLAGLPAQPRFEYDAMREVMETHWAIRLECERAPSAEEVRDTLVGLGIRLGGVFRDDTGTYWTNSFSHYSRDNTPALARAEYQLLTQELPARLGYACAVSGVVEQVIGITKI